MPFQSKNLFSFFFFFEKTKNLFSYHPPFVGEFSWKKSDIALMHFQIPWPRERGEEVYLDQPIPLQI